MEKFKSLDLNQGGKSIEEFNSLDKKEKISFLNSYISYLSEYYGNFACLDFDATIADRNNLLPYIYDKYLGNKLKNLDKNDYFRLASYGGLNKDFLEYISKETSTKYIFLISRNLHGLVEAFIKLYKKDLSVFYGLEIVGGIGGGKDDFCIGSTEKSKILPENIPYYCDSLESDKILNRENTEVIDKGCSEAFSKLVKNISEDIFRVFSSQTFKRKLVE